jgi:vesicle-fusing ATPase
MSTNAFMGHDVDLERLAEMTRNFSGAEIEGLVKSAASYALNRNVDINDLHKPLDEDTIKVDSTFDFGDRARMRSRNTLNTCPVLSEGVDTEGGKVWRCPIHTTRCVCMHVRQQARHQRKRTWRIRSSVAPRAGTSLELSFLYELWLCAGKG